MKKIFSHQTIDEKSFNREVNCLLNVNHENVVRFLGFCACTEPSAMRIQGLGKYVYAEIRERLLSFEYIGNGSLHKYITGTLMLHVIQLLLTSLWSIYFFFFASTLQVIISN